MAIAGFLVFRDMGYIVTALPILAKMFAQGYGGLVDMNWKICNKAA